MSVTTARQKINLFLSDMEKGNKWQWWILHVHFFITNLFTSWEWTAKWLVMSTHTQQEKGGNSLGLNFSSFSIYFFSINPFFYCWFGNFKQRKVFFLLLYPCLVQLPYFMYTYYDVGRYWVEICFMLLSLHFLFFSTVLQYCSLRQGHYLWTSESFIRKVYTEEDEIELCWELHHIKRKLWCLLFHNFHFLIAL